MTYWPLAVFLAIVAGLWWVSNRLYPNRACRWCKGGKWRNPFDRKAWRDCWFCGGTGRRRHMVSRNRTDAARRRRSRAKSRRSR